MLSIQADRVLRYIVKHCPSYPYEITFSDLTKYKRYDTLALKDLCIELTYPKNAFAKIQKRDNSIYSIRLTTKGRFYHEYRRRELFHRWFPITLSSTITLLSIIFD